jgi:uncharacterized cupredoxin-like copper-binding protein
MKRLVVAFSFLAAALVSASAADAVDVCSYTVTGALGVLCPVFPGNTVCLSKSAVTGNCDVPLRCVARLKSFCLASLVPKSGPSQKCAFGSRRPFGLRCFVPPQLPPTPTVIPGTTVDVTLAEFSVTPNQPSAPPGHVTFHVTNNGEDMHEFLVIKTDLAPDMLPTEANGSYEEDGPGTDLLDEIELVPSGESRDLGIDLEAGHYVLICNMVHVEEDGVEVHYQLGMRTAFTVHVFNRHGADASSSAQLWFGPTRASLRRRCGTGGACALPTRSSAALSASRAPCG